jgi:heme/copper-type cytochrome/quinol oxidase subunit 4
LELEVLLQAHADAGIALAGFASVVAALRRPLSVLARQRFLSLLALAVIQILGCLLPMWFMHHLTSSELGWRVLSAVLLVLSLMRTWWLVLLPARHLGVEVLAIINPAVGRLVWGAGLAGMLLLLLNIVGLPLRPGFDLYYAGLLVTLLVGFVLFADAAVGES